MVDNFYSKTAMGQEFDHNPVIQVQARQLQVVATHSGSPLRVLDLRCGAGTPTKHSMSDGHRFSVAGADLSSQAWVLTLPVQVVQECNWTLNDCPFLTVPSMLS